MSVTYVDAEGSLIGPLQHPGGWRSPGAAVRSRGCGAARRTDGANMLLVPRNVLLRMLASRLCESMRTAYVEACRQHFRSPIEATADLQSCVST